MTLLGLGFMTLDLFINPMSKCCTGIPNILLVTNLALNDVCSVLAIVPYCTLCLCFCLMLKISTKRSALWYLLEK